MIPAVPPTVPSVWRARRAAVPRLTTAPAPEFPGADWMPLRQAWRTGGPEGAFQPGWARVSWQESALCYEVLFAGAHPRNRARQLNEPTWELGDVCEVFLQGPDDQTYVELHVTPENQRLQLRWPPGGLARVRSGELPIQQFQVDTPDCIQSEVRVGPAAWAVQAVLPARQLGLRPFTTGMRLRTAVCRYDCGDKPEPVLSSTAGLREPSYHRWQEWHKLVLVDSP